MKTRLRSPLLILVLFLTAGWLTAGETGKIAGKVTDLKTGEPLVGTNVVITAFWIGEKEVPLDIPTGAATDMQGDYFIINLQPGHYTVLASYVGYQQEMRTHVEVTVDKTTRINFQLSPQSIQGQEVTVTAFRREKVEKDLTATKQVYDVAEVQSIAGVNDIRDILNLQADVVDDHFRGGRVGESQYLLGGGAIVNPLNNQSAFRPIVTGLEMVEVYTSGFSAEYGNAQSGVVNMVTKEGRNLWESRLELSATLPYYKTWEEMLNGDSSHSYRGGSPYNISNLDFFRILMDDEEWLKENPTQPGRALWDAGYGFGGAYLPQRVEWPPNPLTHDDSLRMARLGKISWLQSVRSAGLQYKNFTDYRMDFTTGGPISDNVRIFIAGRQDYSAPIVPTPQTDFERQIMSCVTFQPSAKNKFKFSYIFDNQFENYLDGNWLRWVFDRTFSVTKINNISNQFGLDWKYVLSHATFLDIRFNILDIQTQRRIELLNSDEFLADYSNMTNWVDYTGPSNHRVGRPSDDRGDQTNTTYGLNSGIVSQVNKANLMKAGFQFSYYKCDVDMDMNVVTTGGYRHVAFKVNPYEGGLYVQDKMEFEGLIANIGLRLDFYNLNTDYYADQYSPLRNPLYDPSLPYLERGQYYDPKLAAKETTKLYARFQPRIGISFPVSETSVFHLNYGTFTQRPNFNQLFYNQVTQFNEIEVLGNPCLKPENTKAYDIGLVKGLGAGITLDMSAYYKDVKDLVETAYFYDEQQSVYRTYINRDYADIKGFHVNLEKVEGSLRWYLRYNYEMATGKSSNDLDAPTTYFETPDPVYGNVEIPDPEDIYLDYNRTHKMVMNLRYKTGKRAGFAILGIYPLGSVSLSGTCRFSTGRPYTFDESGLGLKFNQRTPTERELSFRIEKAVRIAGSDATLYIEAFNVLNEIFWNYSATFNDDRETPRWHNERSNILTYNEYPPYYSSQEIYLLRNQPRHFRMGLILKF